MTRINAKQMIPSGFDFGSIARNYESWYHTPRGRRYDRCEQAALRRFLPPAKAGQCLLDVGCGSGHWSRFFASNGYEVTGIDISEEMIQAANSEPIKHCRFQAADANHLPFTDHCFDVITAITVLEFVPDSSSVLVEMHRCVRPGGRLLLGILNRLAPVNRLRIKQGREPYVSARLYTPREVYALLEPYGNIRMQVAVFVPRHEPWVRFTPIWEKISLLLRRQTGAVIVAEVCP
jgi:ubiquinone/menaquinone biosynthesis C-methylase UbiE